MAIKLGTENKNKTYAAIGLFAIALILAVRFIYGQFFGESTPPPVVATPKSAAPVRTVSRPHPATTTADSGEAAATFAHQAIALPSASLLDPTLHPEVMAQAEATAYTGDGRNIFSLNSAPAPIHIEQVKAPIRAQAEVPQGPPPPPPPPNIDLKFYAYYAPHDGGVKRVCLLHGEDIFIAAEGDIVDRRYKVIRINPFSVDVQDMAYTHTQTLPLSQN